MNGTEEITTQYFYDRDDNLIKVVAPEGQETLYKFDDFGRIVKIESPDSGMTIKIYDKAGNIIEDTDAEGITQTKSYDALNRILNIQYPNNSSNVYFYYDEVSSSYGIGRLTGVSDPSGETKFNYFRTGFLKDEEITINSTNYKTSYSYNKNGGKRSMIYPSGRQIWYNLNMINGKPASISGVVNGETKEIISNAEYLPFGELKNLNFGNGLNLTRIYDLKYRLTSNSNGQISTSYSYDNEYNILTITGSISRVYGYDDIYRLTSGSGVWGSKSYSYDRNGNRLSKNENGFITSYIYQGGTNRLISTGGYEAENFSYNANGSITRDNLHTYQYGGNGHLASIDNGNTGRFYYDYEMRRRKGVYQDKTILFFYDQEGKLISEKDLSTGYFKEYIYLGLEPIGRIDQRPPWIKIGESYLRADKTGGKVHLDWTLYGGSETFRILRSTNDFTFSNPEVIQELNLKTYDDNVLYDGNNYAYKIYKNVPTEVLYFYHCDHLMTPINMTDESQTIVWDVEYYPFGRIYNQSGEIENNIRFPGQYAEKNLNLYYNWHRYYSPKIGRYNKVDLYILESNLKPYNYSENNPVLNYDPSGLKKCSKCDQCPKGEWRIDDLGALSLSFKLGKNTISWHGKIHCMNRRPGEYVVNPLEYYPITIKCKLTGIDIGGSIGFGFGKVTNKCNINEVYNELWKGSFISPPIIPISGIYTTSDSGSTLYFGLFSLSLEIGGGEAKCIISPKNNDK